MQACTQEVGAHNETGKLMTGCLGAIKPLLSAVIPLASGGDDCAASGGTFKVPSVPQIQSMLHRSQRCRLVAMMIMSSLTVSVLRMAVSSNPKAC